MRQAAAVALFTLATGAGAAAQPLIERLNREINAVLKMPDVQERAAGMGNRYLQAAIAANRLK